MNRDPCAYFEGNVPQGAEWLAGTIADQLRGFGTSRIVKKWFVPRWVVEIEAGGETHVILLSARRKREWRVVMLLPSKRHFFKYGQETARGDCSLKLVAHQIHKILSSIQGASGLRWYLYGAKSSVTTPEELPWA